MGSSRFVLLRNGFLSFCRISFFTFNIIEQLRINQKSVLALNSAQHLSGASFCLSVLNSCESKVAEVIVLQPDLWTYACNAHPTVWRRKISDCTHCSKFMRDIAMEMVSVPGQYCFSGFFEVRLFGDVWTIVHIPCPAKREIRNSLCKIKSPACVTEESIWINMLHVGLYCWLSFK